MKPKKKARRRIREAKAALQAMRGHGQLQGRLQHRAMFARAGTTDMAIAVDARPKRIGNGKTYSRKGRRNRAEQACDQT